MCQGAHGPLPVLRLEDYHTRACYSAREWRHGQRSRQYLLDARFGVILAGDRSVLERAGAALQKPAWGVWFGRKSCIPAEPVYRGLFDTELQAQRELVCDRSIEEFTTVTEVKDFEEGTDSVSDQPVSFGDGASSGPDKRQFGIRRIAVKPGSRHL